MTRLGLGTAPLGGLYAPVDEATAEATIARAWDLGLRFFDTAPQYGNGLSERRLGAVLRTKPRDDYVLATKVGRLLRRPVIPGPEDAYYKGTPDERPVFDFSHDGVLRSVEESLGRLGLDRIDILHIHDPDDHFDDAIKGAYVALDRLRSEGTIHAVGAGMNQIEMLERFAGEGRFDCFLLAGRHTLLEQNASRTFLPICQATGIGVIVGGVYNSGVLADPEGAAKFNYQDADAGVVRRARELRDVCETYGVPLRAAAIQFPAAHPAVSAVLTGARSVEELVDNDMLFRSAIPGELWDELKRRGFIEAEAPTP